MIDGSDDWRFGLMVRMIDGSDNRLSTVFWFFGWILNILFYEPKYSKYEAKSTDTIQHKPNSVAFRREILDRSTAALCEQTINYSCIRQRLNFNAYISIN
jgi:hypothetical protein